MALLRYAVPALAVAVGAAAAQCSGTTTIQSAGDATALAQSCGSRTYTGDIVIATGVTDSIALNTITGISGSLTAENATQLPGLTADSIKTIGNAFTLMSLTALTDLTFPMLTSVGSIDFEVLPALQSLSFGATVSQADSVTIIDTMLGALDGIDLMTVETLDIESNAYLSDITMQLKNVGTKLTIGYNADDLQCSFSKLVWANDVTFRSVSSVSIPSLAAVNASIGFYTNSFSSLSAPALTDVGKSLTINASPSLTNVTMPELTKIGGAFQLANNTELAQITGFPKLESVTGAIDISGKPITDVELPALNSVSGGFNLQSSQNIDDICNHFQSISGMSSKIRGPFTCSKTSDPQSSDGSSSGDGTTSADGSTTSTGAANPMLIPGATGVLGVVLAIFGML